MAANYSLLAYYQTALNYYFKISIGNKPWPIGVAELGVYE